MPLLETIDPTTIILVIMVCFVAAAVSGMSGFGAGLIIALFITPIIGAKAVVPAISVVMLINNASRIWFFRSALDWRMIRLIGAPAVVAAALGSIVYVQLDSRGAQLLLGSVLVLSIPLRRYLAGREWVPGTGVLLGFGGVFGFLSSLMVGAGALVVPFLLGGGLAGAALLATDAAIAVAVNLVKIVMFGKLDALTGELFLLSLVMGMCTIPGTWLASWIVRRTQLRLHTALIEVLVVCGGLAIVFNGLTA